MYMQENNGIGNGPQEKEVHAVRQLLKVISPLDARRHTTPLAMSSAKLEDELED